MTTCFKQYNANTIQSTYQHQHTAYRHVQHKQTLNIEYLLSNKVIVILAVIVIACVFALHSISRNTAQTH